MRIPILQAEGAIVPMRPITEKLCGLARVNILFNVLPFFQKSQQQTEQWTWNSCFRLSQSLFVFSFTNRLLIKL